MKNWIYKLFTATITAGMMCGCEPTIDVPAPSSGDADFTNYVAVGNSLTAGYADGGLYADAQMQSYPAMIAGQMNKISPITFTQPDIPGNGSGYIYLTTLAPTFGEAEADNGWLNQLEGPFNNLGVPGIRVADISFGGYGSAEVNEYFYRMLGGKDASTTYLSVVSESQATFFTCWMGNNDVLGYATSGGSYGIAGQPGTGINGLTDKAAFASLYSSLINAFGSNAKGVVVTIPNVTLAPFFTTVPVMVIPLDEPTAASLMSMSAFGGYNAALDGLALQGIITAEEASKRKVMYNAGINPVLIHDADLADLSAILGTLNPALAIYGQTRQANENDLMLLTSQFEIATLADPNNPLSQIGVVIPLADEFALTRIEISNINEYTDQYNSIIREKESANIGVVEIDEVLTRVNAGIFQDGVAVNGEFVTGGAFSLDGIHLTPRGYAIAANAIIEEINSKFDARISPVIINNHRAVVLP
jgi:lysophospholipase L1-like esterase